MSDRFAHARQERAKLTCLKELLVVLDHEQLNKSEDVSSGTDEEGDELDDTDLADLIRVCTAARDGISRPSLIQTYDDLAEALRLRWDDAPDDLTLRAMIETETGLMDLCGPEHPARAACCTSLASSLFTLSLQTGERALLEEAIHLEREALVLHPVGHPERHGACSNLATSLLAWFEQTQDSEACMEAIQLYKEALALQPYDNPGRDVFCSNLVFLLQTRMEQTGDNTLLGDIIHLDREIRLLRPAGHPERDVTCSHLAVMLGRRYEETKDGKVLEEAIRFEREALALRPIGHPERHISCSNLAISLRTAFGQTGKSPLLDEAIAMDKHALALRPVGHPDRHRTCTNLAVSLRTRFIHTGDATLLDEAIQLEREVVAMHPAGHPGRPRSCNNLAISLRKRFEQTGSSRFLDEAILLDREVLSLHPAGHIDRYMSCMNLGLALGMRFKETGDLALLDEAIQLNREALTLLPTSHSHRPTACTILAMLLRARFPMLHDEIVSLDREALALRPPGHSDRHVSCSNLSTSLKRRFRQTGDVHSLHDAIQLSRDALALRPVGHPDRHQSCINLAILLQIRARSDDASSPSLDEAARLLDDALSLTSADHPDRWGVLTRHVHLALSRADHATAVSRLHDMLASPLSEIPAVLSEALPHIRQIDFSAVSQGHQRILLESIGKVLDLIVLWIGFLLERSGQLDRAVQNTDLGPRALVLASRVDDLAMGLQLLERARGLIWSQMLQIRDPEISQVPTKLAKRLGAVLHGTDMTNVGDMGDPSGHSRSFLSERDLHHEQRSQLQHVLQDIRACPGLDNFMRGPDSHALITIAARHPVVVLVAYGKACHALIIKSTHEPLVDISLDIDATTLQSLTFMTSAPQQRGSSLDPTEDIRAMGISKRISGSHTILARLWRTVAKPVIAHLNLEKRRGRSRPRIHWCPTGPFVLIPVHAAGIYQGLGQECCADYVVSSYAPTLTALLRAQNQARVHATGQAQMVSIAVERAHDPALSPLPCVGRETRQIVDIATSSGVRTSSLPATVAKDEVIGAFQSANVVHLACHGIQDSGAPHESRFCLGSTDLAVSDLIRVDLPNAFFAFLSACDTAKGTQKHADEVVHLAATMLFAGFQSVAATMWAMRDDDGPFVTKLFYEALFAAETIDVDDVAYALEDAVAALRKSGATPDRWATFVHLGA